MKIDIRSREDGIFVLTIDKVHIPLTRENMQEIKDQITNALKDT